ncbi:MAG: acyltransferase family protein [Lachnospiraceae bacterium]|nr:acyltransferase family protein [Lachnospiraceae bacterium]
MNQTKSTQRNIGLDILRILACLFVVISHTSSQLAVNAPLTSFNGLVAHIMNTIGHTGTILFLFISGSLLLSEDYSFIPRKFYTRNFLRLLIAYYSWVIIYHLVGFIQRGIYTPTHAKDVLLNIIEGKAGYHFWYLPMLLGIYLLLPFLRAICHKSKALVAYFVAFFLVVQIGFSTLLIPEFPYKYLLASLMNRIPLTLVNHYAGYFVLGYFLTQLIKDGKIKTPRLWGWLLIISGPLLSVAGDFLLVAQQGTHNVAFNGLFAAPLCISAIGFFLLFHSRQPVLSERGQHMVLQFSKLTFGIYMLHPMILSGMNEILPGISTSTGIPGILLMTILVFFLCGILSRILCLIPFLRKWIFFA